MIGKRVVTNENNKMCRFLWNLPGTIIEACRPGYSFDRERYWRVRFDKPAKRGGKYDGEMETCALPVSCFEVIR